MPLKFFKSKKTSNSSSNVGSVNSKRFKIDPKTWRTVLSVVLFVLGSGAIGWGGLNLLDYAQVPECVYVVDEQREQFCQISEDNQGVAGAKEESEINENTATDSAGVGLANSTNLDFYQDFQPFLDAVGQITVQIFGAVNKPGVFQLNFSNRLGDLIKLAGGLAEDVDQQYIIKNLNLAQRLKDEQKIYIPYKQEQELVGLLEEYCRLGGKITAGSVQINKSSLSESSSEKSSVLSNKTSITNNSEEEKENNSQAVISQEDNSTPTNPIDQISQEDQEYQEYLLSVQEGSADINSSNTQPNNQGDCISINNASSEQLQTLTGVGPSTATKIIEGRPYANINDLLNVSGIGTVTLEKLEPHICL